MRTVKTQAKLYSAIQSNDTFTENGMPTHSTSGSYLLDLFFKMGGARQMSENDILSLFVNAFNENRILAIKAMFYNRDVRGGQGERRSFQIMFKWLCENHPEIANHIFDLVPEYGRWDDLFVGMNSDVYPAISQFLYYNLVNEQNVLLKKWMPRENKSKRDLALFLMEALGMSPAQYRKAIALHGEVVENDMCNGLWDSINYNHVPSVASKNYRKAFGRHDAERYGEWLSALEKGSPEVKINAGAIFPSDVIKSYLTSERASKTVDRTVEAQWKALPDFVPDGLNFIAVVDTSGSMSMYEGLPRQVAYSLGIYLAERNKTIFKDAFITFSRSARLISLGNGSLREKVNVMLKHEIVEDTNFESVFRLILDKAVSAKLSQEDMPTHVLVLSDMQFNPSSFNASENSLQMIKRMYQKAGYELPQIIYWNVRSGEGVPVKFNEAGVALVSGFSPSLMKSVLSGSTTPMNMMLNVLDSERYAVVEERLS